MTKTDFMQKAINFAYSNGSEPNGRRTVYVDFIHAGGFSGWCFERNAHRNFKWDSVTTPPEIIPHSSMTTDNLPRKYQNDPGLIVEEFRQDGKFSFAGNNRIIYLDVPSPHPVVSATQITFCTAKGRVILDFSKGYVCLYNDRELEATTKEVIEALKTLL